MSTPIGMRAVVRAAAGTRVPLEMSAMKAGLLPEPVFCRRLPASAASASTQRGCSHGSLRDCSFLLRSIHAVALTGRGGRHRGKGLDY